MRKLWENKIVQWAVRIFIIVSMVTVADKLHEFMYLLENGFMTVEGISTESLIKDIKMIQIIGAVIWAIAIGSYNYFIDSINKEKTETSN